MIPPDLPCNRLWPNPSYRWYYRFPGCAFATGPTSGRYALERNAREEVRRVWGLEKLPQGTEFWRAED